MKKLFLTLSLAAVVSCGTTQSAGPVSKKGLYQVLTQQSTGGATIKFYEILTEPSEISMLKADPSLSQLITEDDLTRSNFLILNMGEKPTGGYMISVKEVRETADTVFVTIKETEPTPDQMTTSAITQPYAVVKINSKKKIEFQ